MASKSDNPRPIIVKYESQKCVSLQNGHSTILNIGVDRAGQRWQWYSGRVIAWVGRSAYMKETPGHSYTKID